MIVKSTNCSKIGFFLKNSFPSLFAQNQPFRIFFTENDRTTFDFIENDIFQTHTLKTRKK